MNLLIILTGLLSLNLSINALFINPDILSNPASKQIILIIVLFKFFIDNFIF